jgi:hypothetical protein
VFGNEAASSEIEDETAVHLRIESEVEVIQCAMRTSKTSLLATPFQQSIRARAEFVGNQTGEEVDGHHGSARAWRSRVWVLSINGTVNRRKLSSFLDKIHSSRFSLWRKVDLGP